MKWYYSKEEFLEDLYDHERCILDKGLNGIECLVHFYEEDNMLSKDDILSDPDYGHLATLDIKEDVDFSEIFRVMKLSDIKTIE